MSPETAVGCQWHVVGRSHAGFCNGFRHLKFPEKILGTNVVVSQDQWTHNQLHFKCIEGPTTDYPTKRLPLELWTEIFLDCLPVQSYPRLKSTEAPLILGQVCQGWRNLALSSPRLWSSFEIDIISSGGNDPEQYTHLLWMMQLWIHRSGNCPLSIELRYSPCRPSKTQIGSDSPTTIAQFVAVLMPHTSRWRRMRFVLPSACTTPLQEYLPGYFPALKSLTLDMGRIWFLDHPLDVFALGIDWARLTEIHLHLDSNHLLSLDQCLQILTQGTMLARCVVSADCVIRGPSEVSHKIYLPRLNHLHLHLRGGAQVYHGGVRVTETPDSCLVTFLDAFKLPELESLELEWLVQWDGGNRYWSERHPEFISILRQFSQSLRTLRLAYLPLVEREVMECLACLPFLVRLDLLFPLGEKQHDPITDNFCRALTLSTPFHPQISGLLPQLESISLQCYGQRCKTLSLMALIESRRRTKGINTGAVLTSFRFLSMQPVTEALRNHVKNLNRTGLDVVIDYMIVR